MYYIKQKAKAPSLYQIHFFKLNDHLTKKKKSDNFRHVPGFTSMLVSNFIGKTQLHYVNYSNQTQIVGKKSKRIPFAYTYNSSKSNTQNSNRFNPYKVIPSIGDINYFEQNEDNQNCNIKKDNIKFLGFIITLKNKEDDKVITRKYLQIQQTKDWVIKFNRIHLMDYLLEALSEIDKHIYLEEFNYAHLSRYNPDDDRVAYREKQQIIWNVDKVLQIEYPKLVRVSDGEKRYLSRGQIMNLFNCLFENIRSYFTN